jgi:DNA-binding response OmpR family regulator
LQPIGPRRCTLLIVETHQPTLEAIAGFLAPGRHRVTYVPNPDTALALVQDRVFDLILVSLALPGNAGVRLLQDLNRCGDTPVVALVGGGDYFALNYQLRMATASGVAATVVKPLTLGRLSAVLDQVL